MCFVVVVIGDPIVPSPGPRVQSSPRANAPTTAAVAPAYFRNRRRFKQIRSRVYGFLLSLG
jgi:hypothetical protein